MSDYRFERAKKVGFATIDARPNDVSDWYETKWRQHCMDNGLVRIQIKKTGPNSYVEVWAAHGEPLTDEEKDSLEDVADAQGVEVEMWTHYARFASTIHSHSRTVAQMVVDLLSGDMPFESEAA